MKPKKLTCDICGETVPEYFAFAEEIVLALGKELAKKISFVCPNCLLRLGHLHGFRLVVSINAHEDTVWGSRSNAYVPAYMWQNLRDLTASALEKLWAQHGGCPLCGRKEHEEGDDCPLFLLEKIVGKGKGEIYG